MKAFVRMHGELAGVLARSNGSISFQYDPDYLAKGLPPVSLSLPLQAQPYIDKRLPPYFEGLVSEGWLRRIQAKEQRIDPEDHFALLVHNGRDLPGAITIELAE
ncbi:HipA N-terminal domain-containing protein [Allohahella sp. A8]|uniref:HipA N-terminal domain-containing protein n=1 Tax=Allohahella sp. A8 TaxID=3141461 RepID=UPI000C0AF2C0|nr:phosphatidylinositol kinase [Hahellaceae bacterium]